MFETLNLKLERELLISTYISIQIRSNHPKPLKLSMVSAKFRDKFSPHTFILIKYLMILYLRIFGYAIVIYIKAKFC